MDDHSAKRKRASSELPTLLTPVSPGFQPEMPEVPVRAKAPPPRVIGICNKGDATIVVKGLDGGDEMVGLRISIEAVSLNSPVLKRMLAEIPLQQNKSPAAKTTKVLPLVNDNATALLYMFQVLHLRNSDLPPHIDHTAVSAFVEVAAKYGCVSAVSRAVSPWFDYIYTHEPTPLALYQMAWAAMILGDAVYFARFSSRWVLTAKLDEREAPTLPFTPGTHMLSKALLQRQKDAYFTLRSDIDELIEPLAESISDDCEHWIDCAPGDDPTPVALGGDAQPVRCTVDKEGAALYLGALRDAQIWPANWPPHTNLLAVTEAVDNFRIPEHDPSDACHHCSHVEEEFALQVLIIRKKLKGPLWGLCLQCFLLGSMNPGECTYEHEKPKGNYRPLRGPQGNPSGRPC